MTTFLRYYSRENSRHADAEKIKGTFDMAKAMTDALCKHFRVPKIKVKLFSRLDPEFKRLRKVQSWYRGGSKLMGREAQIVYHPTMLTPLTVAHEVAHYVDDVRAKQARVRRVRWHSAAHRALTDQGVAALKAHPRFGTLFDSGILGMLARDSAAIEMVMAHGNDMEATTASAQAVNKFYDSLPEKLTCPCCHAHIPKRNFGVRVMKRDSLGIPVIIRRQSYCKACR